MSFVLLFQITPLVSSNFYFDHCIVCPLIYCFRLPHWYLQMITSCIVCPLIYCFRLPHWYLQTPFVSLYCMSFDLLFQITPLVSSNFSFDHCIVCPLIYCFRLPFDHCIVCPLIYCFRLPHWYLQTFLLTIVLYVL